MDSANRANHRTVIVGAGMAGLAAAIQLAGAGENVLLLEAAKEPGGKMREIPSPVGGIDSGPTVFTMKYVFEELFDSVGECFEEHVKLTQASTLARHAWDDRGIFDLHADRTRTMEGIASFFGPANASGYQAFCEDAGNIFSTLKDTFIGSQRPTPVGLGRRVGITNYKNLWQLQPFHSLMSRLYKYFPDPRLQQLFGRYATYVGSSPFASPATLMLIAHVEQEGVWMIEGGMHSLAKAMSNLARKNGAAILYDSAVSQIIMENGQIGGVVTEAGRLVPADRVLYCGDVSALREKFASAPGNLPEPVPPDRRSLSAVTWSIAADTTGFPLHRHNVFFSSNYAREFDEIFNARKTPMEPTVYVCAQDRHDDPDVQPADRDRLLCLVNAPANGDIHTMDEEERRQCRKNMISKLESCGLSLRNCSETVTTPADFNKMHPGSGGALYGRASHGWMASFARPGGKTRVPGLYLGGGSVHPGPGVPMATRSGMLAAEQILADRVST